MGLEKLKLPEYIEKCRDRGSSLVQGVGCSSPPSSLSLFARIIITIIIVTIISNVAIIIFTIIIALLPSLSSKLSPMPTARVYLNYHFCHIASIIIGVIFTFIIIVIIIR